MLIYLMFIAPAMLLALWAQLKVKSAYTRASQLAVNSGYSGRDTALYILQNYGINDVQVEQTEGHLSDHYDPKAKVLRLSPEVYNGRSVAALGIAAHEAGHALQDKENYTPLVLRNGIVPLASVGSNFSYILIFLGAMIGAAHLMLLGIGLFSLVVIFQLVNLPVEFDASARAKDILLKTGLVTAGEQGEVSRVLSAAALTYVAATVTAIATLLYYLFQMGLLGGRDE